MMKILIILIPFIFLNCATIEKSNLTAIGDSSSTIRSGIITTVTAPDGTVTEICGTEIEPCQERTSVGGQGSVALYESIAKWVSIAASIGMVALSGGL